MDQQQNANDPRKQEALREQRRILLKQLISPDGLERLKRVALVKPEKEAMIETLILQNSNRLASNGGQITESQIISLLEQHEEGSQQKITIKRKGNRDDDDWDEW